MKNNVTNLAEKMEISVPVVEPAVASTAAKKIGKKTVKPIATRKKIAYYAEELPCKPNRLHCETIITNATKTSANIMYACIPLELMDVDPEYQRPVTRQRINKLKANWNDAAAGALIVSYRNDRFIVMDGNGRRHAAYELGKTMLHCQIHVGLTQSDEAKIFTAQDKAKSPLNGSDRIKSGAVAEDPIYLGVRDVCQEFAVNPYRSGSKVGVLTGATRAAWIVGRDGPDMLRRIFRLVDTANWHLQPNGYGSNILSAFRNLCLLYEDDVVESAVKKICCGTTPAELIILAQATCPNARGPVTALTTYLGTFIEK